VLNVVQFCVALSQAVERQKSNARVKRQPTHSQLDTNGASGGVGSIDGPFVKRHSKKLII
jgi:hypothetical protein